MDRALHAISDPTRRLILDLLTHGEMSAGDISNRFPEMSRPAISQHLAVLKEAGLVHQEKKGRHQIYRLNPKPLQLIWEHWLSKYELFWQNRLLALKQIVENDYKSSKEEEDE